MSCRAPILLAALVAALAPCAVRAAEQTPPAQPAQQQPAQQQPAQQQPAQQQPNLDFDLLDEGPKTGDNAAPAAALQPPVDEALIKRRRLMLNLHQGFGIGLTIATAGAIVTGQLNYNDKFLGDNSGRYELAHQAFVYPAVGLAAVTSTLAFLAPEPLEKKGGFDRFTLHKIGQFTALGGWATELGLGLYTSSREGFVNQKEMATAHLAVGYVTLAGLLLGLGAVIF